MSGWMIYYGQTIHDSDQFLYYGTIQGRVINLYRNTNNQWLYTNPANPSRGWPYPLSLNHPGITFYRC